MKKITIATIAAGVVLTVAGAASVFIPHHLTGQGTAPPTARWYPVSTDFGEVEVGQFADHTIRLKNVGGGELTGVVAISPGATGYTVISGGGPYTLRRHESKYVTVRFAPPDSLPYEGDVLCSP